MPPPPLLRALGQAGMEWTLGEWVSHWVDYAAPSTSEQRQIRPLVRKWGHLPLTEALGMLESWSYLPAGAPRPKGYLTIPQRELPEAALADAEMSGLFPSGARVPTDWAAQERSRAADAMQAVFGDRLRPLLREPARLDSVMQERKLARLPNLRYHGRWLGDELLVVRAEATDAESDDGEALLQQVEARPHRRAAGLDDAAGWLLETGLPDFWLYGVERQARAALARLMDVLPLDRVWTVHGAEIIEWHHDFRVLLSATRVVGRPLLVAEPVRALREAVARSRERRSRWAGGARVGVDPGTLASSPPALVMHRWQLEQLAGRRPAGLPEASAIMFREHLQRRLPRDYVAAEHASIAIRSTDQAVAHQAVASLVDQGSWLVRPGDEFGSISLCGRCDHPMLSGTSLLHAFRPSPRLGVRRASEAWKGPATTEVPPHEPEYPYGWQAA